MKFDKEQIIEALRSKNLKVTPQRLAIIESLYVLANHPTAEMIYEHVASKHENIGLGTVYSSLDLLSDLGIICKVQSEDGKLRFDARLDMHHHLHDTQTGKISDYFDEELNAMLQSYFANKQLDGFKVKDIKLQIKGQYENL